VTLDGIDATHAGGTALVAGTALVLLVVYRDPTAGIETATAGVGPLVVFVVLPAGAVLAGVYAAVDGPFAGAGVFAFGSYLGLMGLSTVLGNALSSGGAALLVAGLVVVALAVTALVAGVVGALGVVGLDGGRG